MKKILFYILLIIFPLAGFSQVVKLGEPFTTVPVINNEVTFLKEIPFKSGVSTDAAYKLLQEWAKDHYGRDPFISSIRYDARNKSFIAKSRIELLLPANSKGVREKMIMRYRVDGFLYEGKCVLEISGISYLYENSKMNNLMPRVQKAEAFITDAAIDKSDSLQEYKINTRKSTLYFLNELGDSFEAQFGY